MLRFPLSNLRETRGGRLVARWRLMTWRRSTMALVLATIAWSGGCATSPRPAIEPAFAARTYTPIRIALLPPDVFMVRDQVGENDPAQSEALRQAVFNQVVQFSTQAFKTRGYDLNLSAPWTGVVGQDGQLLVSSDELATMANSILQFANGPSGGLQGALPLPEIIAPELAAKIGWATQSDALLYVNLKGISTTSGKRTAQVLGVVFIVVVVALVVLALLAESKGGRGGNGGGTRAGGVGRSGAGGAVAGPISRGTPGVAGGSAPGAMSAVGRAPGPAPMGRGFAPAPRAGGGGGRVYRGGGGPGIGIGVGVMIPLGDPVYTHQGQVTHEDEWFGGDEMYLSMTLVNASDGRVLWHLRQALDFDPDNPKDVQDMVGRVVGSIPLRGDLVEQKGAAH